MAKWLDKYDAPKAQNGIEGTMGGLTDKGFNYNGAWGGPSMEMGGNIQPPMAGAVQTLPMYQMGGYVYPTTFVPEAEMGASLPGSVGFTYARTQGIPSEGPYAKKTLPSAQKGKLQPIKPLPKRADSDYENFFEIFDPTGISSWDDIYRSYKKTGMSPQTKMEIFGAIPLLGKLAKVGKFAEAASKTFSVTARQKRNADAAAKTLKIVGKTSPAAGRATDAYQAYDEYQNGGEMSFYQHGLDWTPRNISKNGSVVKDNNGYWNPDNWGKVVEIDSPNITMKGVNQDLIGVSDTGDVQYMTPGNDYIFDGNRVKEYPAAKYGVNQQDEKTVQHLDQLLNFTNKPKAKNGWLSKYE